MTAEELLAEAIHLIDYEETGQQPQNYVPLKAVQRNIAMRDAHPTLLAKFSASTGPSLYLPQLEDASTGSAIELQAHRALLQANQQRGPTPTSAAPGAAAPPTAASTTAPTHTPDAAACVLLQNCRFCTRSVEIKFFASGAPLAWYGHNVRDIKLSDWCIVCRQLFRWEGEANKKLAGIDMVTPGLGHFYMLFNV